jgi:hypothetical protein
MFVSNATTTKPLTTDEIRAIAFKVIRLAKPRNITTDIRDYADRDED